MKNGLCLLALLAASGLSLFAQRAPAFELYGNYSYIQFNPTVNGLNSKALNGGGGGFQFNMGKYFGLKLDLQGYASGE